MCCFLTALALREQHSEGRRTGLEPGPGSVSCAPVVTRRNPQRGPAVGGMALATRIARWLRGEEATCTAESGRWCLSRRLAAPLARRQRRALPLGRPARRTPARPQRLTRSAWLTRHASRISTPSRSSLGPSQIAEARRPSQCTQFLRLHPRSPWRRWDSAPIWH